MQGDQGGTAGLSRKRGIPERDATTVVMVQW